MDNCTHTGGNCDSTVNQTVPNDQLGGDGVLAFCVIIAILLAATIVAYVLTLTTLCSVKSMAKTLQIFLLNLLSAGLATAVTASAYPLTALVVNWAEIKEPSLPFCRFAVWAYAVGATARLFNVAAFSVAVLLVVKYSIRALKCGPIALTIILLWSGVILLNSYVLVPQVYAVQYVDGMACFPRNADADIIKPARYSSYAIWITFGGVVPVIISIVVPIVVLCYIKRNHVTESSNYNKGIAKFTLFLVSGNLINLFGQAVVSVLYIVLSSDAPAVYLTYSIALLSLLPSPVLVIVFLKPVREKMKASLFCHCFGETPEVRKSSATLSMA